MKRRRLITLLGSMAALPLLARAQQPERIRRVGVLMTLGADDPIASARVIAFVESLQQLGWRENGNLKVDVRWNVHDPDRRRSDVAELVALAPDVVPATGSITVGPLLQAARCRLYSSLCPIRSEPGSLRASHGLAATPLAFCNPNFH